VALTATPLHKLLTGRTTTTTDHWAANVVDALAWVALAATAGIHYMQVASDRIYLAANPGENYFFVNVVVVVVSGRLSGGGPSARRLPPLLPVSSPPGAGRASGRRRRRGLVVRPAGRPCMHTSQDRGVLEHHGS